MCYPEGQDSGIQAPERLRIDAQTLSQSIGTHRRGSASKRAGCYPQSIMGKRIFLFLATNLAIILTLSVVVQLLGLGNVGSAFARLTRSAGATLEARGFAPSISIALVRCVGRPGPASWSC